MKKIIPHLTILWSLVNLAIGGWLWYDLRRASSLDIETFYFSLPVFIAGISILNSILAYLSLKNKEVVISYLFNALTLYLLLLLSLQIYFGAY